MMGERATFREGGHEIVAPVRDLTELYRCATLEAPIRAPARDVMSR
jgi:hypothetical protein